MKNSKLYDFTNEQKKILKNKIGFTGDFFMTKQECNDLLDKVVLQLQIIGWDSDGYPNNKEGVLLEDIITELTKK